MWKGVTWKVKGVCGCERKRERSERRRGGEDVQVKVQVDDGCGSTRLTARAEIEIHSPALEVSTCHVGGTCSVSRQSS